MIVRWVNKGAPRWTKQGSKWQQLLFLDETSPLRGLGSHKVKSEARFVGRLRTALSRKLLLEILREQPRDANLFPDENSENRLLV